ncbi:MAG: ferrochelatase [Ferrimicrobium sp.]
MPGSHPAVLWFSFGGPEGPEDIWPFLKRVTAGRNVPHERLELVAEQYRLVGGTSPINQQNRLLIEEINRELSARGVSVPIYFANRNWNPLLQDTVREMTESGIDNALVIATSAFGSYSGCRQYQDDLSSIAPSFPYQKLPPFGGHPRIIQGYRELLDLFIQDHKGLDWTRTAVLTTAHSIPLSMATTAPYEAQLDLVLRNLTEHLAEQIGTPLPIQHCYQSRSGDPRQLWLEPDIATTISTLTSQNATVENVVLIPIGFISDHQEVRYDLDILARHAAERAGLNYLRLPTISAASTFVPTLADFIQTWLIGENPARDLPAEPAMCTKTCCLSDQAHPHSSRP